MAAAAKELRALRATVAALPTEAQASLLLDLLPSLPPAARAVAASRAAAVTAAYAAAAPRLAALAGARAELARMAPQRVRECDERNDFLVQAYNCGAEAVMARCAALAEDAHAVGVVAGLAARECGLGSDLGLPRRGGAVLCARARAYPTALSSQAHSSPSHAPSRQRASCAARRRRRCSCCRAHSRRRVCMCSTKSAHSGRC
jgi:hypothetical protein